ncbi:MAG TPA: 2-C-methyl-D-erythritol 4-phosphate cytidylyltransferase [Candidatus Eisenbacteria bacterium]
MSAGAILLCGGTGRRLGLGVEKPLVPLHGRPLFAWSLEALERCDAVAAIVVVGPAGKRDEMLAGCGIAAVKVVAWVDGGRERRDSVALGLKALPPEHDLVVVHDCARALVSPPLVARVVADAMMAGASIAAIPLEDTLKRGTLLRIDATVPRTGLWRAQTPQAFRRDWLEHAHATTRGVATDDAMMVEACGHPVRITEGDPLNFKITTQRDLALATAWLAARAE